MRNKHRLELKKIVDVSYESVAAHFSRTREKIPAADFQWAAGQIGPDEKVLDAGCGNGRLLACIKIEPENYVGYDQSQSLLSFAKSSFPDFNFFNADLESAIFPANYFDVIFCSAVLGHIPGKKERIAVLSNFLDACRPGGRMVISFWKGDKRHRWMMLKNIVLKIIGRHSYGLRDLLFPWKDELGHNKAIRYYHLFKRSSFCREISASGWKILSVRDERYNYWVVAEKERPS